MNMNFHVVAATLLSFLAFETSDAIKISFDVQNHLREKVHITMLKLESLEIRRNVPGGQRAFKAVFSPSDKGDGKAAPEPFFSADIHRGENRRTEKKAISVSSLRNLYFISEVKNSKGSRKGDFIAFNGNFLIQEHLIPEKLEVCIQLNLNGINLAYKYAINGVRKMYRQPWNWEITAREAKFVD